MYTLGAGLYYSRIPKLTNTHETMKKIYLLTLILFLIFNISWNMYGQTISISDEATGNTIAGRAATQALDDNWVSNQTNGVTNADLFSNATTDDLSGSKTFSDANGNGYTIDWQIGFINEVGPGTPTSTSFTAVTNLNTGSVTIGTSNTMQGTAPNPFSTQNRLSTGLNSSSTPNSNNGLNAIRLVFTNSATEIQDVGFFLGDLESRPNNGTVARAIMISNGTTTAFDIIYNGTVQNGTNYTVTEPAGSPTGPSNNDNGDWGDDTSVFLSFSAPNPIDEIIIHVGDDDHTSSNTGRTEQLGIVGLQIPNTLGPAPVQLINLSAQSNKEIIQLNWSTASEENNDYFDIEWSFDGRNFEKVGTELGAGTSVQRSDYEFNHESPMNGTNYYRLKQVDFNGDFEYSNIVSARIDDEEIIKVFPSLARSVINIVKPEGLSNISIYNVSGQQLKQIQNDNNQQIEINIEDLPVGNYFITISSAQQVFTKQFIRF